MDMGEYYNEVEEIALEGFKRLNATDHVEQKKWDVGAVGSWEVSVVRGEVLKKATLSRIRLNIKNPLTGEDMRLDAVQAKAYPASPGIPILLFNVENRVAREDKLAGFLDVIPVAASEDDVRFMSNEIKNVAERHGEDYEVLRCKIDNMYKMDHWEKALNAAVGIRLEFPGDRFDLVKDAGLHWLRCYFTIVEQRQKDSYDQKDTALRDTIWARILEYYLLGDVSISVAQKQGVPLEAMTLGTMAPLIRY